jgi:predicted secreted hydrolase
LLLLAAVLISPRLPSGAGSPADQNWERALPGYHYEFPRDHFSHPGYQTEWWYYTGNLRTLDGSRFGFELTFFRQGVARPAAPEAAAPAGGEQESPWDLNDVYLADLALSDLDGRRFYHTQRLNRAGPGLAGADLASRRIWNGNWQVQFEPAAPGVQPVQSLHAVCDDFTLQLVMRAAKPPVIHGVYGVSQKAAEPGQASHYISYTRLDAQGTLQLAGKTLDVSGLAWMDHEFFSHQLTAEQTGWDWFSVQLSSGEELMLFRLRRKDGSADPYSAGTFVDARGIARHLTVADFTLQPGATWTSPATGARYPLHWTLRVPALGLVLDASTPLENQEMVSGQAFWPTYWEGAIEWHGTKHDLPVSGVGYLEMTGYDHPMGFAAH